MTCRSLTFPLLLLSLPLVTTFAAAQDTKPEKPSAEEKGSTAMVGKQIPDLSFKTHQDTVWSLYGQKKQKAIVVVFLSTECPVSCGYSKPLADIHKEFQPYGVTMIGLVTNEDMTDAKLKKFAKDYDIPFPLARDKKLFAANVLQADYTPEVFVLDGDYTLRYRGRIDNRYFARLKQNPQVTCHDLHQVLGELMSGRQVSAPATLAIGCPITRQEVSFKQDGPVTYYRDVEPILQQRCQSCHRPGEVGPFSLLTFQQAYNWADDIKTFTQSRQMPPWKPTDGLAFHNERKLTQKEIDTLAAWVDGGTPMGDAKAAHAPAKFPEGWQLGEPDLVLTVPGDFQVGPTGHDIFRCFVLPTKLGEDKYVAAVEVRPGDPTVVHHALLFVDTTGQGRKLEEFSQEQQKKPSTLHPKEEASLDKGPGYSVSMGVGFIPQGGLSGWAPGSMLRYLPDGYGYFLPKNADVVLQVHYHRNGRVCHDQTRIGLYFAKKPDTQQLQNSALVGGEGNTTFRMFFRIPAGKTDHKLTGSMWATDDCELFTITPHMHMLGKTIKVTMTPPGGGAQTVIALDWDYNWQETYLFKTPVQVKKGTRFDVEAVFDNSAGNPYNPNNPPRDVTFGEETTNEMCFVFMGGTSNGKGRKLPLTFNAPK